MKINRTILSALFIMAFLTPIFVLANGGDQRIVERGKYYINLSRAPFTPRVGVKTSFVASFFDVGANRLISENLIGRVRISKFGESLKGNFVFEQNTIAVKGGILEFSHIFSEAALHEIFFDFAFASDLEKVYEAPDFLLDVQEPINGYAINRILTAVFGGFVVGLIVGWFGKRMMR